MNHRHAFLIMGALAAAGCETKGTTSTPGVPQDVKAIIFLQRAARNEGMGNVFDYTSFAPGGRLVKLEPPAADGKLTVLTEHDLFKGADIMSWDLSFDARTIVMSAKLGSKERYHLFTMGVDGSSPKQITEGPYDHVYPIFVPGGKILHVTSKNVEAGAPQFRDEYERQVTSQVATINVDGTGEALGPRNVSHRVAPALLPDGSVVYTEWRHLGDINDGHLRLMNSDMTGMREAFGGEGSGVTNSYLKARHVSTYTAPTGRQTFRLVAIGTERDRTVQAGKLLAIDLGGSERASKVTDLTPLVPEEGPSQPGIGRYYDAEPIGAPADLRFLVSWADGPVESDLLAMAKTSANFGIYVFDAKSGKNGRRFPIFDDPAMWDILARPVRARPEPPVTQSPINGESFTVGALNVYETSVRNLRIDPGTAIKVRILEGFSSEEGFPDMFGLTEFDGQSRLGEVPVYADGSFAAKLPANVPVHMQLVDKFGMSIASEDIWVSGRAGEQRFCGGCHEDRTKPSVITPGSIEAVLRGATDLDVPRAKRVSTDFSYDKVRGVPWNLAIQPMFDAKCVACHDGDPSKPGNFSYTVTDKTLGTMQTFVFDLRGHKVSIMVGEDRTDEFSASYISLLGLTEEFGENLVMVSGNQKQLVQPGSALKSEVIKKLNPPQRFPAIVKEARAFPGKTHPADVAGQELTPDEYYLLMLNIDMGGQYYFRENRPKAADPGMGMYMGRP